MNKTHSSVKRFGVAGVSVLGVMGVALLTGAGPPTTPTNTPISTPITAPISTPTTAPTNTPISTPIIASPAGPTSAPSTAVAVTPAATAAQAQLQDQQNGGRGIRSGRNRGGRGGNSSGGSGSTMSTTNPYAVLQERSIFVKGNQSLNEAPPVRSDPPPVNRYPGAHENQLIFNGVTIVNEHPEAFVEDLRSNVVGTVKIGDAVAGGTVAAISFDDLAYLVDGKIRHVGLGDDFTGNAAFASVAVAPTTGPVTPTAPGQVVGTGASIPAPVVTQSGLSSQDILARMKAKREQEAHQIGGK